MKALIFFDINGTIIKRDHRTDLPYGYAINKLLSTENAMDGVDTSARSDRDVFIEVLGKYEKKYSEKLWNDFLTLYIEQLEIFTDSDVWRENADAIQFIKKLSSTNHMLSLITGELSIGAEYKLKKLEIWQYFESGGFGEDGLKRFDIADSAYSKAIQLYGKTYDELYVIGDTLLDIKTARHLNAKIISITTGSNTRDELEKLNPDYLINEFSEIEHLFL